MALTLWLPETARAPRRVAYRCNVPECGKEFPQEQREQYRRHVIACAKKNEDKIEAACAHMNDNAITGLMDPERHDWLRKRQEEGLKRVDWLRDGLVR